MFLSNFEGIRHPVWYYQADRQTEEQEQWTVGIVPIPPVENYQVFVCGLFLFSNLLQRF